MAIEKARNCGMGMIAVRNSSHFGIAGIMLLCSEGNMDRHYRTNARLR